MTDMKKACFLLCFIMLLPFLNFAQYADLGTSTLKNKIWWFDWSGFTLSNGASKTFNTTDGLAVTITFSQISGPVPVPSVMTTWTGAVTYNLYDFSNTAIKPALYIPSTPTFISKFSINVTATRNGVATPFTLVGVDAEASATTEFNILQTTGSNWQTIDFYRNSTQTTNPLSGCNTQTATITNTFGSFGTGQIPVIATTAPANGVLGVNVTLNETDVFGGMGVAFGILEPVDRGFIYHHLWGCSTQIVLHCEQWMQLPHTIAVTHTRPIIKAWGNSWRCRPYSIYR